MLPGNKVLEVDMPVTLYLTKHNLNTPKLKTTIKPKYEYLMKMAKEVDVVIGDIEVPKIIYARKLFEVIPENIIISKVTFLSHRYFDVTQFQMIFNEERIKHIQTVIFEAGFCRYKEIGNIFAKEIYTFTVDQNNKDVVNIQPSASTAVLTQLIPGIVKLPLQVFEDLNISNAPDPIPGGDAYENLRKT